MHQLSGRYGLWVGNGALSPVAASTAPVGTPVLPVDAEASSAWV